jgi:hypothetical protein
MSDPKLDPIWLDTCVVIKVYNGDKIAEYFLKHLHDEGYELLLVPAANNELLDGNPLTMDVERPVWEPGPTESTRAALEALKLRLGITVDMSAGAIPMKTRSMYAMQGHRKADAIDRKILIAGKPKRLGYAKTLGNLSESDNLVVGQVVASAQARKVANPIMVTAETGEKGMLRWAHLFKVTAIKVPPSAEAS